MSYTVDILRTFDFIAGIFAVISGMTCVCLIWYFHCMSYYDFKDLENNREYRAVKKYLKLCAIILVVCLIFMYIYSWRCRFKDMELNGLPFLSSLNDLY